MPGLVLHREMKPLGGNYLQQVGPAPSAHLWCPHHLVSFPLFSLEEVYILLCALALSLARGIMGSPHKRSITSSLLLCSL